MIPILGVGMIVLCHLMVDNVLIKIMFDDVLFIPEANQRIYSLTIASE